MAVAMEHIIDYTLYCPLGTCKQTEQKDFW
jgi:hypothetical protein